MERGSAEIIFCVDIRSFGYEKSGELKVIIVHCSMERHPAERVQTKGIFVVGINICSQENENSARSNRTKFCRTLE
jgi:hypothetical protein